MMVLLVFVKVPNRTVDPDARKSRARVTVNVRSSRGIGWSWNLTTGYPELWTSRKPSAKVPCGDPLAFDQVRIGSLIAGVWPCFQSGCRLA